ncbi:MAG: ATP-binding cassette domain-containing protein [Acidimicrobiales bacterium]
MVNAGVVDPVDEEAVLRIDGLSVEFGSLESPVRAVNDVTLELNRGETLGIIGESGSGKSVTAMSILRLLPVDQARVTQGRILFDGTDLLQADAADLRRIRGKDISIIFQDPATSLHPSYTIGAQLIEALRVHDRKLSRSAARIRSAELIASVGIAHADDRLDHHSGRGFGSASCGSTRNELVANLYHPRPACRRPGS